MNERKKALKSHNNHFCLLGKSQGISFKKAIDELKSNFKKVDKFITEENVNSHF